MEKFSEKFRDAIREVLSLSTQPSHITGADIYQEADERIRDIIDTKITENLLLEDSTLSGAQYLNELCKKSAEGSACLILCEHYSNMDLPIVSYLMRKAGAKDCAKQLLAIAGMKLNEDEPALAAFSGGFTRIIICPSHQSESLDPERHKDERLRLIGINRSAMKKLDEVKHQGKIILLFPSGTRYRPWDPHTRNVRREVDSYIKSFDYMCFCSINGIVLHINQGKMVEDTTSKDLLHITVSPIYNCADFRKKIRDSIVGNETIDKKQAVADKIRDTLLALHNEAEPERLKKLQGYSK
ncbi:MAG: 1-acyl-sn-glycerol-3-phosphate acyltransferase [Termitinemataceae bacterium]|nr:MAG: 1-acyl-sn-glycerol-3-phosphate acyltransferase [Termitinemataceae bacterium]